MSGRLHDFDYLDYVIYSDILSFKITIGNRNGVSAESKVSYNV